MQKGDLVLVPFPFTDLSSIKRRPALVLTARDEIVTLVFITTKVRWKESWDILLETTEQNGLKKPSLLRLAKITTLDKSLIKGKIGDLSNDKMKELNKKLKVLFDLD